MIKAASTYVYVKQRLHPGLLEGLANAGAEAIEIFCARGHFDYTDRSLVRQIAGWFGDRPVKLNSLHSPMYADTDWGRDGSPPINIAATEKVRRIEAMDEIKRAIEVAELAPFRFLVQHVGTGGENFDAHKVDAAMSSIEHLRAFAKPLGVTVLLENTPNELSTPERLVELIQTSRMQDVGVCFDLGHAHIMGDVAQAFDQLQDYIRSTHVHDNAKDRDAHLWPGEGSIEWNEAVRLLHGARHAPPLLLEIEGDGKEPAAVLEGFRASFHKLAEIEEKQ